MHSCYCLAINGLSILHTFSSIVNEMKGLMFLEILTTDK